MALGRQMRAIYSVMRSSLMALAFIVTTCATSSGQEAAIDTLKKRFDRFRVDNPQEKIFIQTDQETYLTGETLWFAIYYVDGALHQPNDLSKVAYVEILDKDDKAVVQSKIALKNGMGSGSLFLPASIPSGNYQLRSYTQWMKNFSPDYFFHKTVAIVNTFRKLDARADTTKATKPVVAQFFPEGGDLVYGIKSKVGFRVTDTNGNGVDFSGVILNQLNDTISMFQPLKYGLGNFLFKPVAGDSYRAVISSESGKPQAFDLPAPKSKGYVIQLRDSTADMLALQVTASEEISRSQSVAYYVIHSRQIVSHAGSLRLQPDATIMINKKVLQQGISHITVFDAGLMPVCERLYFKPVSSKLQIDVKANQTEYGVRRKVVLSLSAETEETAQPNSSLSVAVFKSDSLSGDRTEDILSYLWLTSDLQGQIESPGYYFTAGDPEVNLAVDNLMLTHGWRRFKWADVLNGGNKTHSFLPEYRGHLVSGTVVDQNGQSARGIGAYLSTPGKNIQLYTARSKENGEVQFEMKDFWGSRKIIVQTNVNQDSTYRIRLNNPYSDAYAKHTLPQLSIDPNTSATLLKRSVAMQVQDIYYGDKAAKFSIAAIDSMAFYGKANETYFLDDYTRFTVMEEVMREYVPGVMVRKRRDGFHFIVLDNTWKRTFQDDPLVLLDGTPIFDVDAIMAFDPLKVKKLEVFTTRYYLGPLHFSGIVSYSTYTGDLAGFQLDPKTVSLDYEGLQRQRVFNSPSYDTESKRQSRLPDRRNLLFWAPHTTVEKGGRQELEFFTSDLTGTYTVVVQGLNENGDAGSAVSSFAVKQFNN